MPPKRYSPSACPQIVENCICTLRNLSYRLELEMPPSRQIGGQELDGLLGSEPPSKDVDSSCWGRKKKKKKKSLQEDSVSEVLINRVVLKKGFLLFIFIQRLCQGQWNLWDLNASALEFCFAEGQFFKFSTNVHLD